MRDSPVSESGSTSFQDFTAECTAEFTAEFTTPIKERSEAFPLYQRNWGKLSQKTEDYHILIKRSHSTSSGSAQPTRQRDAALACISQAPLSSETFTPIKVKLVLRAAASATTRARAHGLIGRGVDSLGVYLG